MSKVYVKRDKQKLVLRVRYLGLCLFLGGMLSLLYFSFPLLSWKLYFEPAFASNSIETPVPKTTVLNQNAIKTLIASAVNATQVDFSNAQNWFPEYKVSQKAKPVFTTYNISIPKLKIKYANVSTIDTNLDKHLIHYPGTVMPSEKGNAVIFGHSTLPQLFNVRDYKTIFATLHTIDVEDRIVATVNNKEYVYVIKSITVTTPDDMSIFTQEYNDSYLTLVTCTPPGTTWKRLIVKAQLDPDAPGLLSEME